MKFEIVLKISGPKTDVKFIKKCWARNKIKKSPESAIATFFAMDDFKSADFAIMFVCSLKNHTKIRLFEINYNPCSLIYIHFKMR